ncbi:MAG: thioredoxin domain-containing protein [Patescibacteria group bacterium]
MDRTRWIIFAVICFVLLGTLVLNKKSDEVKVDNINPAKVITADKKGTEVPDHIFGTTAKKVVLIEYGDFQCPGCAGLHPTLKPIKEKYKNQLTFVFRNFPLTSIHPNALAASTAAEAAGLQDKWWQYHDKLYENQSEWSEADATERLNIFTEYAKDLGLNIATFKKDLEAKKISQKIARDQALGKKIGATSTPTIVLDGKILSQDNWETSEKLEAVLVQAIKDSGQKLPE